MSGFVAVSGFSLAVALPTGPCPLLSVADLSFNPLRLALLVGWVYLCLYLVQRVNFSPLVPQRYKTMANAVTLFTGPFLLLTLFVIDTAQKGRGTGQGFWLVLQQQLQHLKQQTQQLLTSLHTPHADPEEETAFRLLDSAGRSIDEVCGHGNTKRADARILDLTEMIIADAVERRASDILIDGKDEANYTIRLRVDGVLRVVMELNSDLCRAVISSVKAVAGMDISERRRPQDGAFTAKKGTSTASFRVATAGALHGEKLSIRILNKDAGTYSLTKIGISERQYGVLTGQIAKPAGMILMCGPTGSGKTTTLYAMLNEIDRFTRNVITVEDPVEAMLPQASQIEINAKADITFAKALRSVLRQDPDVICVGEIRDEETAEIALRAAQTGHLVLATVHSESNATALIRLLDLGISPLMLSAGLNVVVSQRLLRCLCPHCKQPAHLSDSQIDGFKRKNIDPLRIYEATGCKKCDKTGYVGRTAICDLLVVDESFKAEIAQGKSLMERLRAEGTQSLSGLRKEGLRKVVAGITSLDEIKRVVG
jgi:general secretion pathway protein E